MNSNADRNSVGLKQLILYFLKLGSIGFGGPIALVASMQKELVDERSWFSQETFKEGMAISQLAPGPLAAQLAVYLGWAHSKVLGATLVGFTFVIPSFLMVIALAVLYIHYGSLPIIQKLFHGIGPAVIAIIGMGAYKLSKRNLKNNWKLWFLAITNALIVAITESEIVWIFLLSGLVLVVFQWKMKSKFYFWSIFPSSFVFGLIPDPNFETLKSILLFFLKAGTFVFGSGLAIVPFLHGGVVSQHHWLTENQFLDAVAVAMITPGPVVITVGFIGFLVAGFTGASLAAIGTFLPCYLFTIFLAPYFSRVSKNMYLHEFINGITAAAIGAIIGAVFVLGRHSINSPTSFLIFFVVLLGLLVARKIPDPLWIVLAGGIGVLI